MNYHFPGDDGGQQRESSVTEKRDALPAFVHIGAGLGLHDTAHLSKNEDGWRTILIEPNPENAKFLRRAFSGSAEIHEVALADTDSVQRLSVYNLDDCSSLKKPVYLEEILPGLKLTTSFEVAVRDAGAFLSELDIGSRTDNALLVEAAGEEHAILSSIDDSELLDAFQSIRVNCAKQPMYEESRSCEHIAEFLRARGYQCSEQQENDEDFCVLMAVRDDQGKETSYLKRTIETLENQLTEAKAENLRLAEHVEAYEVRNTELETLLEESLSRLDRTETEVRSLNAQLDLIKDLMRRDI